MEKPKGRKKAKQLAWSNFLLHLILPLIQRNNGGNNTGVKKVFSGIRNGFELKSVKIIDFGLGPMTDKGSPKMWWKVGNSL